MEYREDRAYYDRRLRESGGSVKSCVMSLAGIIILIILCLLTSCKTSKGLEREQEQNRDSPRVEVRYEKVIIRDTAYIEIPAQTAERTTQDSTSHLENDFATSDARINADGTLYHDLRTKPQKKPVEVEKEVERKDSIIYRDRDHYYENTVEKEVEVNRLTWWQKTQIYGLWALLLLYIITHPKKLFSTIVRVFRIK